MNDLGIERHPSARRSATPPPPAADDVIDLGANVHELSFADDAFLDPTHGDVVYVDDSGAAETYDPDSVEAILADAVDLVATARPAAMSSSVKVDRDELLDLLEAALDRLPVELRDARRLLRDREALIAEGRRERDALIDEGRLQVARMVERQEVMRAAERKATSIVDAARDDARALERKVEDYCDARLAEFETFLDRTASTVRQSRQRLTGEVPERRRSTDH